MEEVLSPRQGVPMSKRLQSPTKPFHLDSNNDQLERAQARAAARAAAIRRSVAVTTPPPPSPDPCLSKEQIIDLFQNCVKLASENKINRKNTWDLKLIDHLSEIIKVDAAEGDSETNFQKASCTLEAGVKIYSVRVDSVHSEAYKVLGGINRAGQENEQETITEDDHVGNEDSHKMKEPERKISPLSTLEPSFETLNVKKFDVAFAVDPLYHQTSAQFDEGGAKGLLLNNLGVYEGCRVLFDSFEVPGKFKVVSVQNRSLEMIDISFVNETVEQMVINMLAKNEISPTLREIVCLLGEDNQRSSQTFDGGQGFGFRADTFDANEAHLDSDSFGNYETSTLDYDKVSSVVNERSSFDPSFQGYEEENNLNGLHEPDLDDRFEDCATFLLQGVGFTLKQNAWAGPDHWKYRKFKENVPCTESGSAVSTKEQRSKKLNEVGLDFLKSLDKEMPNIFTGPKNPKSLLLPTNRTPFNNKLPEDCHYQPENLVKLFLLPNVLCLEKRRRIHSDYSSWDQKNDFDKMLPSWDNESAVSGENNDGHGHEDSGDLGGLVSQPRQVNKIEVQYDKTSKQVDVHALKETLWDHMHVSVELPETVCKNALSFKYVLATFPTFVSPHLCFICLLHLANEHGLRIYDSPNLDDLSIHLPSSYKSTYEVA